MEQIHASCENFDDIIKLAPKYVNDVLIEYVCYKKYVKDNNFDWLHDFYMKVVRETDSKIFADKKTIIVPGKKIIQPANNKLKNQLDSCVNFISLYANGMLTDLQCSQAIVTNMDEYIFGK